MSVEGSGTGATLPWKASGVASNLAGINAFPAVLDEGVKAQRPALSAQLSDEVYFQEFRFGLHPQLEQSHGTPHQDARLANQI